MLNTKLILGGVGPQFSKFVAQPYNNAKAGLNTNQVVSTKAAYFFLSSIGCVDRKKDF